MVLSNQRYDQLKFIALVLLPALATAYLGLGQLWGWPETEKVAGSIALIDTALGLILQRISRQYAEEEPDPDGYLTPTGGVNELSGHPDLALTLVKDPRELVGQTEVRLKVGEPPTPPPAEPDVQEY